MSHQREDDPTERPTEGGRDLRNLNLDPEDMQGQAGTESRMPGEERAFERGSGGANADMAVEPEPVSSDAHQNTPHARPAQDTIGREEKPDQLAGKQREGESRQDALTDEAVEETFPASDPISPKRIT